MKLQVVHKNGLVELLEINFPITTKTSEIFNTIIDTTGKEYHFYHNGEYDGYDICVVGKSENEIKSIFNDMVEVMAGKNCIPPKIDTLN